VYEKYYMFVDTRVLGIKYNPKHSFLVLGGHRRHQQIMQTIITGYFDKEVPKPTFPGYNKVRFGIKLKVTGWKSGCEKLKVDNITLQFTTKLGRLFR